MPKASAIQAGMRFRGSLMVLWTCLPFVLPVQDLLSHPRVVTGFAFPHTQSLPFCIQRGDTRQYICATTPASIASVVGIDYKVARTAPRRTYVPRMRREDDGGEQRGRINRARLETQKYVRADMSLSDALAMVAEAQSLGEDAAAMLVAASEIAVRGAERGFKGCSMPEIDQVLQLSGGTTLDARFYRKLLRAVCYLVERGRARRYDAEKILSEMDAKCVAFGLEEFRVYADVLIAEAKRGRGSAADALRVLERMDRMELRADLRLHTSLLKVLAAVARNGQATIEDGMKVLEHWNQTREAFKAAEVEACQASEHDGEESSQQSDESNDDDVVPTRQVRQSTTRRSRSGSGVRKRTAEEAEEFDAYAQRTLMNAMMHLLADVARGGGDGTTHIKTVTSMMKQQGLQPDIVTLNTALAVIANSASRVPMARIQAESILQELLQTGLQPDVVTFNTLISVLLRSSRKESDTMLQDVLSIKACLSDYNLVPDSITFNSVLNAAAVSRERGGAVEMADVKGWLAEMETRGVPVTTSTMNTVMKLAAGMAGDGLLSSRDCVDLVNTLRARAQPDVQTFNLLLSAISKAVTNGKGSLRDAGKVLTEMEQTGVQLNVYTFNSLLNVLTTSAAQAQSQVEVSDVEDVMLRMRDADVTPDVVSINSGLSCLAALAKQGEADLSDGKRFFRILEVDHVKPDVMTFTKYLEIIASDLKNGGAAELDDAKQVLADMRAADVQPSLITFNVLMAAVGHAAGRGMAGLRDADQVLLWMQQEGLEMDAFTVEYYARCARLQGRGRRGGKGSPNWRRERNRGIFKAWDLFRYLPERRRTPSLYAAMIDAFGSVGREEIAIGLLELAESHALQPNLAMFNAALRSCRDMGSVRRVRAAMLAKGIKGNGATKKLLERAEQGADLTRNYNFFV